MTKLDFTMTFDIGTIKHLGLQMYSTMPPVIGELVSNAWDADATVVDITIPTGPMNPTSEIFVQDNGIGMSDLDIREAYLVIGRDRREVGPDVTPGLRRKVMGRKGIGKFSAFGIANSIEIESVRDEDTSRFRMLYSEFVKNASKKQITMPPLPSTNSVARGTKITLSGFAKYHNRTLPVTAIRRRLARRFSVIDPARGFEVRINGDPITPEERDLRRLLEKDLNGNPYLWGFTNEEIAEGTGWKVSGWIGALDRTSKLEDGIERGIVVMARGKLVQEPFVFEATVGQQFALSYIVGELHAEFVDETEDTVGTTRSSLVWDAEANVAFKAWGDKQVNRIAREWAGKRSADNEAKLLQNPLYKRFREEAEDFEGQRIAKVADAIVRNIVKQDTISGDKQNQQDQLVQLCLDFLEFDAFWELAKEIQDTDLQDTSKILQLFRDWEIVEAKEMMRVTEGRITTIQKLENLIQTNALEVPTLHRFLKEFPWVLDPRWNLIADEKTYSDLLRNTFPQSAATSLDERRIDFLCVREGTNLIVVEIKRPQSMASTKELDQIREYVSFMRDYVDRTTDPSYQLKEVTGYLLCGSLVDTYQVRQGRKILENSGIYIRKYSDLLSMVRNSHAEFLKRYEQLRKTRKAQDF